MKASVVYRRAAKIVAERGGFSCVAIGEVTNEFYLNDTRRMRYSQLFRPSLKTNWNGMWAGQWGQLPERNKCRILALLLMSAIAESEGD